MKHLTIPAFMRGNKPATPPALPRQWVMRRFMRSAPVAAGKHYKDGNNRIRGYANTDRMPSVLWIPVAVFVLWLGITLLWSL